MNRKTKVVRMHARKPLVRFMLMFVAFIMLLVYYPRKANAVEVNWINRVHYTDLSSFETDCVQDYMYYNGQRIEAIYNYKLKNNPTYDYNNGSPYCCAALVWQFYDKAFGIQVSNLNDETCVPLASSGYFYAASSPAVGDIVRVNSFTHWAIVRSINADGTAAIIQQNIWYNSVYDPEYSGKKSVHVESVNPSMVTFFRWSGAPEADPVHFDTMSSNAIGTDDIQVSAWLDNPQGKTISEIGVQCGRNMNDVSEKVTVRNVGWTRANVSYKMKTYFGALVSNSLYYIRFFAVAEGKKCYSEWIECWTGKDLISFDTYSAESITDRNATFSIWLDNPNNKPLSSVVVEVGESTDDYSSMVVATNVYWTRANVRKALSDVLGKELDAGTDYYVRCYAESAGIRYYGDWNKIRTANGDVTFDTYRMVEVQDMSARPAVWMDNPRGLTVTIGVECGTTKTATRSNTIAANIGWTRADLSYQLSSYFGNLQPLTHYYARYYVVSGGRRCNTDWFEFTTATPEITFATATVTRTGLIEGSVASAIQNSNGRTVSINVEIKEDDNTPVTKQIMGNVSDVQKAFSADLKLLNLVKANTQYSVRFYATYGSKYYYSNWTGFIMDVVPDLVLPNDLVSVEDNAFSGVENVIVYVPANVNHISEGAFDPSVTILCKAGSEAEDICRELGLTVVIEN